MVNYFDKSRNVRCVLNTAPFTQGYEARLKGRELQDNPYQLDENSIHFEQWENGFEMAEVDIIFN